MAPLVGLKQFFLGSDGPPFPDVPQKDPRAFTVAGNPWVCPLCGSNTFWTSMSYAAAVGQNSVRFLVCATCGRAETFVGQHQVRLQ